MGFRWFRTIAGEPPPPGPRRRASPASSPCPLLLPSPPSPQAHLVPSTPRLNKLINCRLNSWVSCQLHKSPTDPISPAQSRMPGPPRSHRPAAPSPAPRNVLLPPGPASAHEWVSGLYERVLLQPQPRRQLHRHHRTARAARAGTHCYAGPVIRVSEPGRLNYVEISLK